MAKTALVTGANKGIGLEIARELGKKGYKILLGARSEIRGEAAVNELINEGISASFIKIDLNDFKTLKAASAKIENLDILVNNAGIPGNLKTEKSDLDMGKPAFAYTTNELRETMEVNFFGTHELIKNLLPNLISDAKIVNVTVPVSDNNFWHPLAYKTSKAAQNVMTMVFGGEFRRTGSNRQIFGVMPGAVATDLNGMSAGGAVKTASEAAKLIVDFIFDIKNHNGHILNWDGLEIPSYEPEAFNTSGTKAK
ncbi:MAG: SDR family NAD(P)-dependent oxidoreductase [Desulfuromonadales bacterium]|nr:SDR family NAD(P)-dependent oxidoreductase [Desulfuromonadales bacterium]